MSNNEFQLQDLLKLKKKYPKIENITTHLQYKSANGDEKYAYVSIDFDKEAGFLDFSKTETTCAEYTRKNIVEEGVNGYAINYTYPYWDKSCKSHRLKYIGYN